MNPIDLRHILHRHPEPSHEEHETQQILMKAMEELNIPCRAIASTGALGVYAPHDGKPFLLFRADMDALPIEEKTNCTFRSRNDHMHACGHDVHMAILYGLAKRCSEEKPPVNILFLFQPAEETGGGARECLEELESLKISAAFALHVTDEYPLGTLATRKGVLFASAFEVDCYFKGRAVHISMHHMGRDAIEGCAEFLEKIYENMPMDALLRFGMIEGGKARNVVADECRLMGSVRSESWERNEELLKHIENVGHEVAVRKDLKFSISTGSMYPPVVVEESLFENLKNIASVLNLPFVECEMKYTGEDFGFFSQRYPSLMFWLGTRKGKERYGLHSPYFLPPDEAVNIGIEVMWNLLIRVQSSNDL